MSSKSGRDRLFVTFLLFFVGISIFVVVKYKKKPAESSSTPTPPEAPITKEKHNALATSSPADSFDNTLLPKQPCTSQASNAEICQELPTTALSSASEAKKPKLKNDLKSLLESIDTERLKEDVGTGLSGIENTVKDKMAAFKNYLC